MISRQARIPMTFPTTSSASRIIPWWHGSLNDLRQNLEFMATEYQKDIIVVETAYNWQPRQLREQAGAVSGVTGRTTGISRRTESRRDGNSGRARQRRLLVGAGGAPVR